MDRDVAMDVIIMNVRKKMEDVHVNLGGQERDVKTVCICKNHFVLSGYY